MLPLRAEKERFATGYITAMHFFGINTIYIYNDDYILPYNLLLLAEAAAAAQSESEITRFKSYKAGCKAST